MKRTFFYGMIGIVTAVLFSATTALGQPAGGKADDRGGKMLERFPEADADGDGQLSNEEIKAFMQSRRGAGGRSDRSGPGAPGVGGPGGGGFGGPGAPGGARLNPEEILKSNPEADTDGDGKLSKDEMKALWDARREDGLKTLLADHPELDTNGDGQLSPEERQAGRETIEKFMNARRAEHMLEMHPEADTNGDGVLDEAEMKAFMGTRPPQRGGPQHAAMAIDMIIRSFDRIDINGDGNITKAELEQAKAKLQEAAPVGPGAAGAGNALGAENGPGPANADGPAKPRAQRRAGRASQ